MDELLIGLIVAGFYAPLHFLLPLGFLFITGHEEAEQRRQRMKTTVLDAAWSMLLAFALALALLQSGRPGWAAATLMVSLMLPFARILMGRRVAGGSSSD